MVHKQLRITNIRVYKQVPKGNIFRKWKDDANFIGDIECKDGQGKRLIRKTLKGMAKDLVINLQQEESDAHTFRFEINGAESEIRRRTFILEDDMIECLSNAEIETFMAIITPRLGIDKVQWSG